MKCNTAILNFIVNCKSAYTILSNLATVLSSSFKNSGILPAKKVYTLSFEPQREGEEAEAPIMRRYNGREWYGGGIVETMDRSSDLHSIFQEREPYICGVG